MVFLAPYCKGKYSLGGQLFGFVFLLEGQCSFLYHLIILDKKRPELSRLLHEHGGKKKPVSLEKGWGQADAGQGWEG